MTGGKFASYDTALQLVQLKAKWLNSYIRFDVTISLFVD